MNMWEQVGIIEDRFSAEVKSRIGERNNSLGEEHSKKKEQGQMDLSNNDPGRLEISKKEGKLV